MENSKESIFKSIIRSFLRGFFLIFGIFFSFFIAFIIILFFSTQVTHDSQKKTSIEILPDLKGNTKILSHKTPVILQINIHGVIGEKHLTTKNIETILIESRKNIFKQNRIKAILLHIKTPGGGINDVDGIYKSLLEYKKMYKVPIFAYVDGISASGGCYISAAADKIYSNPVSIIGSVGIRIGPFFNVSEALNKIGVETLTLTDGKDKDLMNPLRKWRDNESENLKKIGAYFYEKFLDVMVQSRKKLSKDKLINIYGAQIFDSKEAEKIGFIDNGNSSYKETLKDLLKEAKIDEKTPYQIVKMQTKKPLISDLFKENSLLKGKIKHIIKFKKPSNNYFSYLYIPGQKPYGKNIYN